DQQATIADAEYTAADAEHRALQRTRTNQLRRDSARDILQTFEAHADAIDADRIALERAQKAASVWTHVAAVRGAQHARPRADALEPERRAEFTAAVENAAELPDTSDLDAEALERIIDDLARRLGALDDVLRDEKTLPELTARV